MLPTNDEVMGYLDSLSNWGRWGAEDTKGTINYIDADARRRAAEQIQEGISVSMSRELSNQPTPEQIFGPPLHLLLEEPYDVSTGEGRTYDYLGIPTHGYDLTHLDALRHNHFRGRMYGDRPRSAGHAEADDPFDVSALRDGIFTRGILLDLPRHFGVDWMIDLPPATPEHLDAILAEAGIELRGGDALILRSGFDRERLNQGPSVPGDQPGWHASTLPWLHEHGVALVGADTICDYKPSGYELRTPFHTIGVVSMGLTLIDNMDLREIAETCAKVGRWEFALCIAPLPLRGGTGSPVNPMAIL